MRSHRLFWTALTVLAACGGDPTLDDPATEVRFAASDFAFDGPATIEAGLVTFALTNDSETPHHLQLVRLPDGVSFEEFKQDLSELQVGSPFPDWYRDVGGVNPPPPGAEARVTMAVEPGEYAVLCIVDIPDHVLHVFKGMIQPLTVTAASRPTAPLPDADVSLSLVDFAFGFSAPPTRDTRVIRVRNDAQQSHEIAIVRLLPDKTVEDFMAWGATFEGPPPIVMAGGVPGIRPGQSVNVEVALTPGSYVAVCFLPDATDGAPHIVHGTMLPFTIS